MTPTAIALSAVTGDPTLKLVLLCVAACPGWPCGDDIARAAELDGSVATDALDELVRRRLVVAQDASGLVRYSVPDEGWWTYTRADTETVEPVHASTPPEWRRRLESGDITGLQWTEPGRIARVQP